ncbi:unnamed protein product [Ectocarpus sp. 12 AP-2014]
MKHLQKTIAPTPEAQGRMDAMAAFATALDDARAVVSDASEAAGQPLSPRTHARLRVAMKRVLDAVPTMNSSFRLDRAPEALLEPARMTYAFVKSAKEGKWDILFACQRRCEGYLGGGSGGVLKARPTLNATSRSAAAGPPAPQTVTSRFSTRSTASRWTTPGWTVLTDRATCTLRSPATPIFTSCPPTSNTTGKAESGQRVVTCLAPLPPPPLPPR